ncbi:serine hydrolase [Puniceicoccaceae bacterium K14]|nr:serine hydrolase [Puniceicoccaceae bacterium K14]
MYKKLFGLVIVAHIVVLAYFILKSVDTGDDLDSLDDDLELMPLQELPVVPLEEAQAAVSQAKAKTNSSGKFTLDLEAATDYKLPGYVRSLGLKSGILVEVPSGKVYWKSKSDVPVAIASMTKMMTALVAFETIEQRTDVTMDTVVPVTVAASKIGGSQVWLDPRESFSLRELMISIMVKSANDSSYLVGEYLYNGNIHAFIARMNERATELGMTNTKFLNSNGLPEGLYSNQASCEDLVYLAHELLKHPKAIEWSSIRQRTFRPNADTPTMMTNHNGLIGTVTGVDGLKTGYTKRAGFCITATCERDGRRFIAVANGFPSSKERNAFVSDLLEWGYSLDR